MTELPSRGLSGKVAIIAGGATGIGAATTVRHRVPANRRADRESDAMSQFLRMVLSGSARQAAGLNRQRTTGLDSIGSIQRKAGREALAISGPACEKQGSGAWLSRSGARKDVALTSPRLTMSRLKIANPRT